jgi:putative ubiquitin-RnfH superfamily antitoxin RatB of RatAB toxin-antitoxin module
LSESTITVEVAYALPDRQEIVRLAVPEGTTALEAAERSGIAELFDDLQLNQNTRLGVFGGEVAQTRVLSDGERVEIYRSLIADPKEARRARAQRARESH